VILVLALYLPAFLLSGYGWWWAGLTWLLVGHLLLVLDVTTATWRIRRQLATGRPWYRGWRHA
jgi:hypothetical protein